MSAQPNWRAAPLGITFSRLKRQHHRVNRDGLVWWWTPVHSA
ncbi:hypothetical protein RBSH_05240 [Rhodopirellula baltica SH28]|uniref:Uncharacterized protein n=1 Tax=Rhodopirellula baltica SH28 TaxID=993517 RepID=K5E152_RHOBT|nr:hypothetical protein RBSH_05240 [Rhodopirellula baltica SH28]